MRPGKHGVTKAALDGYAKHAALGYVMYLYLRRYEGNPAEVQFLFAYAATVFTWFFLSYSLGLREYQLGRRNIDFEPTTRAWERGPHLSPLQRALRESLAIGAGFATQWSGLPITTLAMFFVGFLAVAYGFFYMETQKEVIWNAEALRRKEAGKEEIVVPDAPAPVEEEEEEEVEMEDVDNLASPSHKDGRTPPRTHLLLLLLPAPIAYAQRTVTPASTRPRPTPAPAAPVVDRLVAAQPPSPAPAAPAAPAAPPRAPKQRAASAYALYNELFVFLSAESAWPLSAGKKTKSSLLSAYADEGRSVMSMNGAAAVHAARDDQGRSLHAMKQHPAKGDQGRSVMSMKSAAAVHAAKDDQGRSLHAMKWAAAANAAKDDQGRSLKAMKPHAAKGDQGRSVMSMKWAAALCTESSTVEEFFTEFKARTGVEPANFGEHLKAVYQAGKRGTHLSITAPNHILTMYLKSNLAAADGPEKEARIVEIQNKAMNYKGDWIHFWKQFK
ncbi:hypothetical protein HDU86_003522 [Geranomyces michiganensis]|nr:hypothetical protein HDU86_003522 [Geranomyces michiganensis]